MTVATTSVEDLTLDLTQEIRINASLEASFAALLEQMGQMLLNPEIALRKATAKFERRFREVEQELERRGRRLDEASLAEMDAIWNSFRRQP